MDLLLKLAPGKKKRLQNGFSFVELILVMGIILTLLGITSINLIGVQRTSQQVTAVDTLIANLREQQTRAMAGDTQKESGGSGNFGVFFQDDRYTLFRGDSFSAANPTNFEVVLDPTVSLSSVTFPGNTVIFNSVSGEVAFYTTSQDSVTVTDLTSGKGTIVEVNRHGVATINE